MPISFPFSVTTTRTGGGATPWTFTATVRDGNGLVLVNLAQTLAGDAGEPYVIEQQLRLVQGAIRQAIFSLLPASVTFTFDPRDVAKAWVLVGT